MADQVLLIIDVEDRGSPQIQKFATNAIKAFDAVQTRGNQAATTLSANLNRIASAFNQAARSSATSAQQMIQIMNHQAQSMTAAFNKIANSLSNIVNPAFNKFQQSVLQATNKTTQAVAVASKQQQGFFSSLGNNILQTAKVSATFLAVNKVLQAFGQAARFTATTVIDFDFALRKVSSISPEVRSNFAAVRQEIINLNPQLGTSAELANALFETLQSGVAANSNISESLAFTEVAARLAKAGLTDAATAVRVLSSSLNAYAADISQAQKFSDILFKSVELGQLTFEQLASAIGPVLPLASQLGISFEEVNAVIATLTQGGFSASEATTAFRSALSNVVQHLDDFKSAGIDVTGILNGPTGIVGLFAALEASTDGNIASLRNLIPDVRGLVAALAATGNQFGPLVENLEKTRQSTGTVDIAFKEISLSVSDSLKVLGNAFDRFVQNSTSGLEQSFAAFIQGTSSFVSRLADALDPAKAQVSLLAVGFRTFIDSITPAWLKAFIDSSEAAKDLRNAINGTSEASDKLAATQDGTTKKLTEAEERVRKGTDAFTLMSRASAQTALQAFQAANGIGQAGESSEEAARSSTVLKASLDGVNKTFDISQLSLSELITLYQNTQPPVFDLRREVDKLEDSMFKNVDRVKLSQGAYTILAVKFSETALAALGYRERLLELGASSQLLQGDVNGVTQELRDNAASAGLSDEELSKLIGSFIDASTKSSEFATGLFTAGVNTAEFTKRLEELRVKSQEIPAATTGIGPAYDLQFKQGRLSIEEFVTQGFLHFENLNKNGTSSAEGIRSAFEKFSDNAKEKIGELPPQFELLRQAVVAAEQSARTAETAFTNVFGLTATSLQTEIHDTAIDFTFLATTGGQSATELLTRFDQATAGIRDHFGRLPPVLQDLRDRILSLSNATQTVEEAATKLGVTLKSQATESAESFRAAFERIKGSGDVLRTDIVAAFETLVERIKASGERIPSNFQSILDRLKDQASRETLQIGDTFSNLANRVGVSLTTDLERSARESATILERLRDSGRVSFSQLAEAWQSLVIEPFIAGGQSVPPEFQRVLDDLLNRARTQGALIGTTLGTGIANGAETAFDRIEQRAQTLTNQLQGLADSASFDFGDTVAELEEQAKFLRATIDALRDAGQDAAAETYVKALSEVFKRLRELREQAGDTAGATGNLQESFNSAGEAAGNLGNAAGEVNSALQETNDAAKLIARSIIAESIPSTYEYAEAVIEARDRVRELTEAYGENSIRTKAAQDHLADLEAALISAGRQWEQYGSDVDRVIRQARHSVEVNYPGSSTDTAPSPSPSSNTPGSGGGDSIAVGIPPPNIPGDVPDGTDGVFLPFLDENGNPFQNGSLNTFQGQSATLEAGEAILTRRQAEQLRKGLFNRESSTPLTVGQLSVSTSSRNRSMSPNEAAGFQLVPGLGYVPSMRLAAASGRLDDVLGPNSQRDLQRAVIPLVEDALRNRSLTRPITQATGLSRKGRPNVGGS